MRPRTTGGIVLVVALAAAVLGVIAAGAPRAAAPAVAAAATPAPESAPSPTPAPLPGGTPAAPPAAPEAAATPVAPALPRIIRTVCTDHVCGGCDGKCRASGHVAVDKKGHCACTPTEGSDLDRAVRQAYERHPPQ